MKKTYFLIAAIALLAFNAGDEILTRLGTDSQTMKERICQSINDDFRFTTVVYSFNVKECKAVPLAERAGVVNAVGDLVKAYIMSDAFSKDYDTYVRNQYVDYQMPDVNDPKWKELEATYYTELVLSQEALEKLGYGDNFKSNIDIQLDMYQSYLGFINEESLRDAYIKQGYTEENLKVKIKELERISALYNTDKKECYRQYAQYSAHEKVQLEIAEQANRFNEKQTEMKERLALNKIQKVKAALQEFLNISADVDFNAQLLPIDQYGTQRFANPVYETEKSSEWKLMYRAGKESVMTARAFAKNWLEELK